MATTALIVDRPKRWDSAFDPNMTDADVARLLTMAPFSQMKADRFPLRDILRNDARLRRFRAGEIIVREGDYGTSAFMIIQGAACVVIAPGLPEALLGRRPQRRKNPLAVLAQLWANARHPEVRRPSDLRVDERLGQRDAGDDEVRVFLQDVPRVLDGRRTASLATGEFFGEIAALSRVPRTATVFAEVDDTELLEIRWQGLRDVMKRDDALRQHIEEKYRERSLETYLRALPMLRHLTDAQLQELMRQTEFFTFGDYDWSGDYKRLLHSGGTAGPGKEPVIAQEGDYPNGVVFVRAGFARLGRRFGRGQRTLSYLGAGQYYGFEEIAHNWRRKDEPVPLQLTLQAIGYTHVLIIPTAAMEELVLPTLPPRLMPPLVEPEPAVAAKAPKPDQRDASAKLGPDLLEFLTENRFFNGTAAMLINLDLCTRCDDCVRACAATHDNNPRFLRHGPASGPVMVANACMHCADPVCMIGCPTGAIHRSAFGGQVVINQATCIGCAICSNNCPYDAIRMVDIRGTDGTFLVDKDMKAIQKATKCDLCVEQYGGPACQRACPHGALIRADMGDVDALVSWLGR
jgi:Fe-S-cluster-containing dehydrogenase component/CRP-like cAMP-binding protein